MRSHGGHHLHGAHGVDIVSSPDLPREMPCKMPLGPYWSTGPLELPLAFSNNFFSPHTSSNMSSNLSIMNTFMGTMNFYQNRSGYGCSRDNKQSQPRAPYSGAGSKPADGPISRRRSLLELLSRLRRRLSQRPPPRRPPPRRLRLSDPVNIRLLPTTPIMLTPLGAMSRRSESPDTVVSHATVATSVSRSLLSFSGVFLFTGEHTSTAEQKDGPENTPQTQ
ncbi:hypothetical protein LX36DRAFT_250114 [Colletotrichum falcatum]|nr:hypothetical protein LX36DRAFT_250114 [Colletotrichum falcatum]